MTTINLETTIKDLEYAKDSVNYLLEHGNASVDMHGIEYWVGRVERLRELIKNSI